jgi:excisionase family DNA binding protein
MESRYGSGVALRLDAPPALIAELAAALADELERRGSATTPPSPYLDVSEAATYLRCSEQRLYDLNSSKTLVALRDGRRLLYRREQLDAYLAGENQ